MTTCQKCHSSMTDRQAEQSGGLCRCCANTALRGFQRLCGQLWPDAIKRVELTISRAHRREMEFDRAE